MEKEKIKLNYNKNSDGYIPLSLIQNQCDFEDFVNIIDKIEEKLKICIHHGWLMEEWSKDENLGELWGVFNNWDNFFGRYPHVKGNIHKSIKILYPLINIDKLKELDVFLSGFVPLSRLLCKIDYCGKIGWEENDPKDRPSPEGWSH